MKNNPNPIELAWQDAQVAERHLKSPTAQARLDWWREARFGMFIHWNLSCLLAAEISWCKNFDSSNNEKPNPINPRPERGEIVNEVRNWEVPWFLPPAPAEVYDQLQHSFYPGMFDADAFAATAKKAGMKYVVMVAKHHDGFCLWHTKQSDYAIQNTPFKRDIFGEMAKAVRKAGLKFGVYYSQRDWHHPDYSKKELSLYNTYMRKQLEELLSEYGEISTLFFDSGGWPAEAWDTENLFKTIYRLQPNIIINDRCGVVADHDTPEQFIGNFNRERDWESCMTFTGCWSWRGYGYPVIPFEECLKNLILCACGDGNLLMNIGPLPTGQIHTSEADRLKQMGAWLEKFGSTIYATRGGPFTIGAWGGSTCSKNKIFLHITDWSKLPDKIPALPHLIEKIGFFGKPLENFTEQALARLKKETQSHTLPITIIELVLKAPAETITPLALA